MSENKWSKSSPSWGRNYRLQRNVYAYRVACAMALATYGVAGVCPCCGAPMDMSANNACEVDRVTPALDYAPGNITYVCEACNQGRALLQRVGRDWTNVTRYAHDVREASAKVSVPTIREAQAEWASMREGREGGQSRYA